MRRIAVALALLAGACIDPDPTSPDGGDFGTAALIPARAWIESGASLDLTLEPAGPFFLRSDDDRTATVAGRTVTARAPGEVSVDALFPAGRATARISVVGPSASRTASVVAAGLTDASLLGVWAADAQTIFAVGGQGVALVSRDGGGTWTRMNTSTGADLTAVWGSAANDVYAVGARGTVIHYDGVRWEQVNLGADQALLEVWGLDAGHVYIVGAGVAYAFDGTAWRDMPGASGSELWAIWGTGPNLLFASGQNGVLLRWDGSTWRSMTSPTQYVLFGLWGTAADEVYAVGIRGTLLRFDGAVWQPVPIPSGADFFAIAGTSRSNIMLVGNGGVVVSFNGTAWTLAPQQASFENLRAVSFDPSGRAVVVGWAGTIIERRITGWSPLLGSPLLFSSAIGADGLVYAVGTGGALIRRRGGEVEPGGPAFRRDFYGIARAGDGFYVVGDGGTILARTGGTWHYETAPTNVLIRSVWVDPANPARAFAVGDRGTALRRVDGQWVKDPTPTGAFLRHVFGLGGNDVFAVGDSGVILRYEGRAWTRMASPVTSRLRGVFGTGRDDVIAVGENGVAIRFDGRRWYRIPTGVSGLELRAVAGFGPTRIYAVGEEGLILRFNGTSWDQVPNASSAYLLGLALDGGTLMAVGTNGTLLELAP